MRPTSGILAFGLATIIAVAGIGAGAGPVAATDPTPSPSTAPSPSAEPAPSVTPAPAAEPSPTIEPAPSATPTPVLIATATATTKPIDRRALVKRIALRQRWDRYVRGATGPNAFDCSGLVRYVYRKAGVSSKLGGGHSARSMLTWGRMKGLTSRRNPKIGDIAIWGNGRHAGIYIGRGYVISALNPRLDIRITRLHALTDPFTTFIHTRI